MSQAILPPEMCEVLVILRSDGQLCDPDPGGEELLPGSIKYTEWSRKLGHWLAVSIGTDAKIKSKSSSALLHPQYN
jgi:hypothetical protein